MVNSKITNEQIMKKLEEIENMITKKPGKKVYRTMIILFLTFIFSSLMAIWSYPNDPVNVGWYLGSASISASVMFTIITFFYGREFSAWGK